MVRFQPGGAGEKQLLLKQLTDIPSSKNVQALAASIRSWRRHFGKSRQCSRMVSCWSKLLMACSAVSCDGPADGFFRLSQSRMQLQPHERPEHSTLSAFSQSMLAEAETLCLMTTFATTTPQTPFEAQPNMGQLWTNPANTGPPMLDVELGRPADGLAHAKVSLTNFPAAGIVAAKSIANKNAQ